MLALAIEEFERVVELMGRLGSYAGLYYAGNQADPERAKFYGDVSEKLPAISTEIIFFDLELNQIDEAVMAQALKNPRLARYKPWIDNVRKEKPKARRPAQSAKRKPTPDAGQRPSSSGRSPLNPKGRGSR